MNYIEGSNIVDEIHNLLCVPCKNHQHVDKKCIFLFFFFLSTSSSYRSNSLINDIFSRQLNDLGQRIRDGSGRNTPEVTGTLKQYSGRKISGFFPVHSDHFPVLSARNWSEITGKIGKFSSRNTASIFRCIPAGSSVFSVSFLQVPSGTGHRNLRPGDIEIISRLEVFLIKHF